MGNREVLNRMSRIRSSEMPVFLTIIAFMILSLFNCSLVFADSGRNDPVSKEPASNPEEMGADPIPVEWKTRKQAILRSLILPGLGQFYKGQTAKGGFFLQIAVGAGGFACMNHNARNDAIDAYYLAREKYNSSISQSAIDAAFDTMQEKCEEIDNKEKLRNYSLYALGGIWLLNLVDASLGFPMESTGMEVGLESGAGGGERWLSSPFLLETEAMNRRGVISTTAVLLASALILFLSCQEKPTAPVHSNLLDANNPETAGDPFHLEASIADGGIRLVWNKLEGVDFLGYRVWKRIDLAGAYIVLIEGACSGTPGGTIEATDHAVSNGHTYEYKVSAYNSSGEESDTTNVVTVQIDMEPMLLINEGAEYTATRICTLLILSTSADSMRVATGIDTTGFSWEPYTTSRLDTLPTGTGEKIVTLQVLYGNEEVSGLVRDTIILDQNPPEAPVLLSPGTGVLDVSLSPTLIWRSCEDREGSPVVYDVYFDNSDANTLDSSGLVDTTHVVSGLERSAEYSWKVVARDVAGNRNASDLRTFTTWEAPTEMAFVPSGSFAMGGDSWAFCGSSEHMVNLTNDFLIGRYEVTNQEYRDAVQWAYEQGYVTATSSSVRDALDGNTVKLLNLISGYSRFFFSSGGVFAVESGYEDHPVVGVSWFGAAAYCDWLSLRDGLDRAYDHSDWSCNKGDPYRAAGYRLPTDAEWEYVTQYGGERIYPWGDESPDCSRASYPGCLGRTSPVGNYPSGAVLVEGELVYDLAGNVCEWCNDRHTCDLGTGSVTDPTGPDTGSTRLLRGGSWLYDSFSFRSASRFESPRWHKGPECGFRFVCSY